MENADLMIRDNDQIYQPSFDAIFKGNGTKVAPTCIAAPDMNSFIGKRQKVTLYAAAISRISLWGIAA